MPAIVYRYFFVRFISRTQTGHEREEKSSYMQFNFCIIIKDATSEQLSMYKDVSPQQRNNTICIVFKQSLECVRAAKTNQLHLKCYVTLHVETLINIHKPMMAQH